MGRQEVLWNKGEGEELAMDGENQWNGVKVEGMVVVVRWAKDKTV